MVRGLAHILRAIQHPAFRRVLALCMVACLMLGPVASAMAVHHMDDVDSILVLSDGSVDTTAKKSPDHASLPAGDHDCHGCSAAVLSAPAWTPSVHISTIVTVLSENLVDGRAPGAEFRPPKA